MCQEWKGSAVYQDQRISKDFVSYQTTRHKQGLNPLQPHLKKVTALIWELSFNTRKISSHTSGEISSLK